MTWPPEQALPRFGATDHLDVADIRSRSSTEKLLLTTLQGVVNRHQPRLHLTVSSFPEGPRAWLDVIDVETTTLDEGSAVLSKYASELEGLVVYDPDVPHTINVATTLAGVAGAAVASPALAEQLVADYDLTVRRDLRGRFDDRIQAYRWLLDAHGDTTTDRMLVGLPPATGTLEVTRIQDQYETVLEETRDVRDGSNRAVREIDLTPYLDTGGEDVYLRFDDARPENGWGADLWSVEVTTGAGETVGKFAPATPAEDLYLYDPDGSNAESTGALSGHRWANGDAYFVYRFSPPGDADELAAEIDIQNQFLVSATGVQPPGPDDKPPAPFSLFRDYAVASRAMVVWLDVAGSEAERDLFRKHLGRLRTNSPYMGWFPSGVAGEFSGVEMCAEHSVYVAPSDFFENMSALSGVRSDLRPEAVASPEPPALEDKVYVMIVMSDGDNLQYDQHRLRVLWDQDARGEVPINWSISPLLVDAAPGILAYYQRTATDNDVLMCGPSGAGYTYPAPWPDDTFGTFTEQTGRYMKTAGLHTMYLLNRENGNGVGLSASAAEAYAADVDPRGIYLPSGANRIETRSSGLLQASGPFVGNSDDLVAAILGNTPASWNGSQPAFVSVAAVVWNMDTADVVTAVEQLGGAYEPVRADHFFDLYRQSTSEE